MRFGRSDLTPEAQRVVLDVAAEIKRIKEANGGQLPAGTKITIDGYTDDRYHGKANGNNPEGIKFNQELSEQRAKAIKEAIQRETGLGDDVFEAKGHGISNDHDNKTAKGRAQNRRVDVVVDVPQQKKPAAPKVDPAKPVEQKADPAKPAAPKVDPAKPVEQKADPVKPAAPKVDPAKPVEQKADPAKPAAPKVDPAKPEAKPVEARKVDFAEIKDKAEKLHEAMDGIGTDEVQIHKVLSQLDAEGQKQLAEYYKNEYDIDLDEHLASELGGSDLEIAQKLRQGAVLGTQEAVQLFRSMDGLGTLDEGVRAALKGASPEKLQGMAKEYQRLYGESLEVALRGDLSGQELQDVLDKLNTDPMDKAAAALYTAMDGVGTDEAAIYSVLAKFDKAGQEKLAAAYKAKYGVELDEDLAGDLSGQGLVAAQKLRQGTSPALAAAVAIYNAQDGMITDRDAIRAELKGKSPQEISAIATAHQSLFGKSLEDVLRDTSAGQLELQESLKLIQGKTLELHELIRSGNLTDKAIRDRIRELRKDPATLEEYKNWYGSDANDDLSKRPDVQAERSRRQEAKKTLEETEDF
jgi:hypothetical protein